MYFITFFHYYFGHHDDEIFWDLIDIDKKWLIVITNNYDTKKNINIIKMNPIIYFLLLLLLLLFIYIYIYNRSL